jgi:fatty-acyl-CoA synthase
MVNIYRSIDSQTVQRIRNGARRLAGEARNQVELARVATEVGLRTGLAFQLTPRGVLALARSRVGGSLGLPSLFRIHAANRPDALAIVDPGRRITYAELDRRIDRLAARLRRDHRISRGDPAILLMHNRAEFVEVQAAMTRIGGAAVSATEK